MCSWGCHQTHPKGAVPAEPELWLWGAGGSGICNIHFHLFLPAVVEQHSCPGNHPGHISRGCQVCAKIVPKPCQDCPEHVRALPSSQAVCHPLFFPEVSSTSSSERAGPRCAQPSPKSAVSALTLSVKSRIPALCLSWSCILPHPLAPGGSVTTLLFLSTEVTTSCIVQIKHIKRFGIFANVSSCS